MSQSIKALLGILTLISTTTCNVSATEPTTAPSANIRLYFTVEETDERLVLERQREGARLPTRTDIEDLTTGYYDVILDRTTTFTAKAFNAEKGLRNIPITMDAGLQVQSYSNERNNGDSSNPSMHCDNIGNDGIGSAYLTHTFSLENDEEMVSHLWHFYLMNQQGEYVEVSGGDTAPSFAITEIEDSEKYAISDGCLSGVVECLYSTSDTQYRTILFPVTLELKPIILNVSNIVKHPVEEWYFYVTFDVEYRGADRLIIAAEEEYSTIKTIQDVYEPFLAHIKTCNISTLRYSWLTIYVKNEYGTAEKTLEFAPAQVSIDDIMASDPDRLVEVFTLQGISVFKGKASEYEESTLAPGMYIRRWIGTDGRVQADKIMVH